jgi:hypothetical protein
MLFVSPLVWINMFLHERYNALPKFLRLIRKFEIHYN